MVSAASPMASRMRPRGEAGKGVPLRSASAKRSPLEKWRPWWAERVSMAGPAGWRRACRMAGRWWRPAGCAARRTAAPWDASQAAKTGADCSCPSGGCAHPGGGGDPGAGGALRPVVVVVGVGGRGVGGDAEEGQGRLVRGAAVAVLLVRGGRDGLPPAHDHLGAVEVEGHRPLQHHPRLPGPQGAGVLVGVVVAVAPARLVAGEAGPDLRRGEERPRRVVVPVVDAWRHRPLLPCSLRLTGQMIPR